MRAASPRALASVDASRVSPMRIAERAEAFHRRAQEPAEPDALAAAFGADAVHAVVPVAGTDQRQTVSTLGQAASSARAAMLEQRADARRVFAAAHSGRARRAQRLRRQKRHGLVENRHVAGRRDILGGHKRKPHEVVGATRAHATAGRRMPPVQHVAFARTGAPRRRR